MNLCKRLELFTLLKDALVIEVYLSEFLEFLLDICENGFASMLPCHGLSRLFESISSSINWS